MTIKQLRAGFATLVFLAIALTAQQASAALIQGNYLGTFVGVNDSEAQLLADLGLVVNQLAKVDWPDESNDGLAITDLVLNDDNEAISGQWAYTGVGTVDIIVIKAGNMYAAYDYTGAAMLNMGIWDTGDVDNKGLSHITAYTVVPIPAAVWLLGSAIFGGLGLIRRKV